MRGGRARKQGGSAGLIWSEAESAQTLWRPVGPNSQALAQILASVYT